VIVMAGPHRREVGARPRAVVVHTYGEAARGLLVTERLVACGYAVVAAAPGRGIEALARLSGSDLPVAHLGPAGDAWAVGRAVARLQRRLAALAVVGGPLSMVFDDCDGLMVPTLVVGDGVSRAARRRAQRRLPRGSRVVRAGGFEAALGAAIEFFERRTAPARPRPLSSRIVPAALLAAPGGLLVGVPAAQADVFCDSSVDADTLLVTCDGQGDALIKLSVNGDGDVLVNDIAKTSVKDIKIVKVFDKASTSLLVIDEQEHKFGTGLGTLEDPFVPLTLDAELDGTDDSVSWTTTEGIDQLKLLSTGLDVTGDGQTDYLLTGAELLKLDLLGGDDLLDGGAWESMLLVDGGIGDDFLIGGLSDDTFVYSKGFDALDGGPGVDQINLFSDDSSVKIGDSLATLTDGAVSFKQFESLSYLGGDADNKVELAGIKIAMDLDGGLGDNEVKLVSDDSSIKFTDALISLADTGIDVGYKDFKLLTYLGGDAANKVELAGMKIAMDLDGGLGDNEVKVVSDDSSIKFTDALISLVDTGIDVGYKDFKLLSYLGGDAANKVELAGMKIAMDLDGGLGDNEVKLVSDDSSIKFTDALISLADTGIDVGYKDFKLLSYLGGDADNKVDLTGIKLQKVSMDAAGGNDLLTLFSDESLLKLTDSTATIGSLNVVDHKDFETLTTLGGASDNKIDGSAVKGLKLVLDGGEGNDTLLGGARGDELYGKLGADVLGGGLGDDKLSGGLGNDQVNGNGGLDTFYELGDVSFTATGTSISGLGSDAISGIESLFLVGGSHDNVMDASRFKSGPVTLDGGDGDDVLSGTAFSDLLLGSDGDDRLAGNQGNDSLYGGIGDDYLDGSSGTDLGDGGPGIDTGKNIEIRISLEK